MVSVANDGSQANGESYYPSLSADGTFLVFSSYASNLVAGDTNKRPDVFVTDLATGNTMRVSVASDGTQANSNSPFSSFTIEPNMEEVLEALIPHYLENQLRSSILESEASEHSSRMIAMRNATDAALDLMEGLTLMMNKIRQEKITYEIADTVTARMALE